MELVRAMVTGRRTRAIGVCRLNARLVRSLTTHLPYFAADSAGLTAHVAPFRAGVPPRQQGSGGMLC